MNTVGKVFRSIANVFRNTYDPDKAVRSKVICDLADRPSMSDQEWHTRFASAHGIPLSFVIWFRKVCSDSFGYDLSAALPDDRLIEDLGLFGGTWDDVDLDILEDYEFKFGLDLQDDALREVETFGEFILSLWEQVPNDKKVAEPQR
jgi:hypothetical protein